MPRYINVIIPVKLGFEPFYSLDEWENPAVGARVGVPFAGRTYIGVVSAVDVQLPPQIKASSVKPIYSVKEDLPLIFAEEIEFWRRLADYYMCSTGEVYKAAYPSSVKESGGKGGDGAGAGCGCGCGNFESGETDASAAADDYETLSAADSGKSDIGHAVASEALTKGGTLFWESDAPEKTLTGLCRGVRGNVLWLVPEMNKQSASRLEAALGDRLVLWSAELTPARKRKALQRIRSGEPYIAVGTRSAVLLPHRNLSLVIVQDEHDSRYKQLTPAPRYNARDAAILLATQSKTACILCGATASLETILNCRSGKYRFLAGCSAVAPHSTTPSPLLPPDCSCEIIDSRAELRKNGMVGDVPRCLKALADSAGPRIAIFKPKQSPFPATEQLIAGLRSLLGDGFFFTDDLSSNPLPSECSLLAIFGTDALLGRADFRADEKAYHLIRRAIIQAAPGQLTIVTREKEHPLFASVLDGNYEGLLAERHSFGFPPYTRLVDILIKDEDERRATFMRDCLMGALSAGGFERISAISEEFSLLPFERGSIRVVLEKDKRLTARKKLLRELVEAFERDRKYFCHFAFDVDPL